MHESRRDTSARPQVPDPRSWASSPKGELDSPRLGNETAARLDPAAVERLVRRLDELDSELRRRALRERELVDLLAQEREAREAAERLADHTRLLAEVSRSFNEVRTVAETIESVVSGAVPVLADICLLDLVQGEANRRAGASGRAEIDADMLGRLRAMHPDPAAAEGPARVLRTGDPDMIVPLDEESLALVAPRDEERTLFRQLRISALICMPLRKGGERLGSLTFAYVGDRTPQAGATVQAAAYADRAGLALAAARVFDDLVRQREAAAAANQAKDRLLATVSHDFRTPLAAIVGYTDLLLGGIVPDIPERALEWVRRIRAGADHQVALVDQILAFTRLESGHTAVQLEATDMRDPVREACDLVRMGIEQAGLAFEVSLPDSPVRGRTDAARVRQVLTNLLSNAIRYTREGGISVALAAVDGQARISVSDTGSGIPASAIPHIFEQYWKGAPATEGQAPNWGLGLAIVRNVVDMLGGTIRVESEPGEGTTFEVLFPLN